MFMHAGEQIMPRHDDEGVCLQESKQLLKSLLMRNDNVYEITLFHFKKPVSENESIRLLGSDSRRLRNI